MKKILAFFQKHVITWMLLLAQIVILIPKLVGVLNWHWALVFIPLYLLGLYWIVLISIGAYLTKRDEKRESQEEEK